MRRLALSIVRKISLWTTGSRSRQTSDDSQEIQTLASSATTVISRTLLRNAPVLEPSMSLTQTIVLEAINIAQANHSKLAAACALSKHDFFYLTCGGDMFER